MASKTKYPKAFPISNLDYLLRLNKIFLNPEYQRGSVWVLSQQQLLIDSLLNDFDIPKLYFREIDKGTYKYEVVDGQQRLRTIADFMKKGGFALADDADAVEGHEVKGKKFEELHLDLQLKLNNQSLDVVILNTAYTDEDVEDMFLRLQNGTPLNAAEKRRALPSEMRVVVAELAENTVFKLCAFADHRYAYEDVAAKVLHLLFSGTITDIRPSSIRKTYLNHKNVTDTDTVVKKAATSLRFLSKAFKGQPSPKLKRFSLITLAVLIAEMLEKYNLQDFTKEFARSYLQFERKRIENEEKSEDKQDRKLAAYTDSARADSIQDLEYRHEVLREMFVLCLPDLALKDPTRAFTEEQRLAVYIRDEGVCRLCKTRCDQSDFHVDHVKAHSKGGQTKISNAQLLCPSCNLKKGSVLSLSV